MTLQKDTSEPPSVYLIFGLVLCSGLAALSWEVVWQIRSTLALGVSAWGTAVTLAVTMGGMCAGALLTGHALKDRNIARPARIYAVLEWIIGLSGLCLGPAFRWVAAMDTHIYAAMPGQASLFYILGVSAVLGVPALCMGATLPVLGLMSKQYRTSIARLYGLNTFGAAAGTILAAFALIPALGLAGVTIVIAGINLTVGALAWTLAGKPPVRMEATDVPAMAPVMAPSIGIRASTLVVLVTGFCTFMLEIAWFRSLTAAFMSTTDAFAIMLACVLIALGFGARLAPALKKNGVSLGVVLAWAGILVLLATPLVERLDLFAYSVAKSAITVYAQWAALTFYIIGAPMILLGMGLPWILDDRHAPRSWGVLYGLNAFAAILGAVGAGWIFLPLIGFARTAWIAGTVAAATGILLAPSPRRVKLGGAGLAALLVAVLFQSGIGTARVQGTSHRDQAVKPVVLESYEGPSVTASAVAYPSGRRALFIDGFATAEMGGKNEKIAPEHYMPWMGHLPMLMHPDPRQVLVICFGTGQTTNAARQENPRSLDLVDLNKNVLKLAHNFPKNENVLADPRVRVTIMDGRAYIRRVQKAYDVITLEPMPPTFAGVNALYSREFYEQARQKLGPHGVMAQWLPFHLLAPEYSASIARTFQSVFPNAVLWIDKSTTGILLGTVDDNKAIGKDWPGFRRAGGERDMTEAEVRKAVFFDSGELQRYGAHGRIISDDNQLLAYGGAAMALRTGVDRMKINQDFMDKVKAEKP